MNVVWLIAFFLLKPGGIKAVVEILGQHLQCEKTSAWNCEDVHTCSAASVSLSPSRFPCVCGVVSCQGSTFYPHVWHSSSQGSQRNNTLHTREPCNCHHIHTLWSTQKWTNPQGRPVFSSALSLLSLWGFDLQKVDTFFPFFFRNS